MTRWAKSGRRNGPNQNTKISEPSPGCQNHIYISYRLEHCFNFRLGHISCGSILAMYKFVSHLECLSEASPVLCELAAGCLDFYHKPVKTARRKLTPFLLTFDKASTTLSLVEG